MSVVRIGNCSGFYGDRLSAMREMLEQGPLDVLTGDYLAELTMLILGRDQLRDPSLGYARTFVRQVEDCLGLALERGVRLVSNAGGLNPAGLAERLREVAGGLGLDPAIAYVDGDDVRPLWLSEGALTANAYLGGFGIAAALAAAVRTSWSPVGSPTPRSWWDRPSGGTAGSRRRTTPWPAPSSPGTCSSAAAQATGGNFSGFASIPDPAQPLGFPLAEVAADGSAVITKHDGTGGLVSLDTVTAQLMYEVQGTQYLGPDVVTDLSSIRLAADGPDRVRVSGVRGLPPPDRLKVGVNELGGFRNSVELVLTGLDIEDKAAWVRAQLSPSLKASSVTWTLGPLPAADADTEEGASTLLRCTVRDASPDAVGRAFSSAAVELALASYPGFTMTSPPGDATPYGVYRAEYVDRSRVTQTVHHADGSVSLVEEGALAPVTRPRERSAVPSPGLVTVASATSSTSGDASSSTSGIRVPLGTFVHARSGDKGGDANLGLWVAHDGTDAAEVARRDRRIAWLLSTVTPDFVRDLLPEARDLEVEVHPLPNLGGVNVVLHGLLGQGVAASTRFDPQAKGLGEWARSRHVEIPEVLL